MILIFCVIRILLPSVRRMDLRGTPLPPCCQPHVLGLNLVLILLCLILVGLWLSHHACTALIIFLILINRGTHTAILVHYAWLWIGLEQNSYILWCSSDLILNTTSIFTLCYVLIFFLGANNSPNPQMQLFIS